MPLSAKVITVTTAPKNAMRSHDIFRSQHDSVMRLNVTTSDAKLASQYFVLTTRANPIGDIPTIQSRWPSSENCGNTNRVVSVARLSEHAPRLRNATRLIQNGLVSSCVKFRKLTM